MRSFVCSVILAAGLASTAIEASPAPTLPLNLAPADGPASAGKLYHFFAGFSVGLFAAAGVDGAYSAQTVAQYPYLLPLVALTASEAAGMSKEILDSTGFGDPRFGDVLITMSGGLAAAAAAFGMESTMPESQAGRQASIEFFVAAATILATPVIVGMDQEIRSYLDRRKAASKERREHH